MRNHIIVFSLVMLICVGLIAPSPAIGEADHPVGLISEAQYPEIPMNPDRISPEDFASYSPNVKLKDAELDDYLDELDAYRKAQDKRHTTIIPDREALERFIQAGTNAILSKQDEKNKLYSPVNLWYALYILSEMSSGETHEQIVNALGADGEALRAQADSMCITQYWDDGVSQCVPGASLWLNRRIVMTEDLLDQLSRYAYADTFRGDLGDRAMNEALHEWLNERTHGILSDVAGNISLNESIPFALFATMYLRERWASSFSEAYEEVFHAPGSNVKCDFLHGTHMGNVFGGERFTAVTRGTWGDEYVVFMLPDEGLSPELLLDDDDVYEFLMGSSEPEILKYGNVILSVPKLDIKCDFSIQEGLENMGITSIFDVSGFELSDNVRTESPVYASGMHQSARITMDEEGIEAAAIIDFTPVYGIPQEVEDIIFTLDRPFLMAIIGGKKFRFSSRL